MEKIPHINALVNYFAMKGSSAYGAAKQGDLDAAFSLIRSLPVDFSRFRRYQGYVAPVRKAAGNAIPIALAREIARHSQLVFNDDIVLLNGKPGSEMIGRFFYEPEYTGKVHHASYILVDDVFTTGITLKGMKDFITSAGGKVPAIYTLSCARYGTSFEPSAFKLSQLLAKFPDVPKYFDLASFTTAQVDYLLRFSSIRNLFNKRAEFISRVWP
jgi:hypothetical protein